MALLWQSVLAAIAPVMHATACSPESISLVMLTVHTFYLCHCIAVTPLYIRADAPLRCN